MFEAYQRRFPALFEKYDNQLTELETYEKEDLLQLIELIDKTEEMLTPRRLEQCIRLEGHKQMYSALVELESLYEELRPSVCDFVLNHKKPLLISNSIVDIEKADVLTKEIVEFLSLIPNPSMYAPFYIMLRHGEESIGDTMAVLEKLAHDGFECSSKAASIAAHLIITSKEAFDSHEQLNERFKLYAQFFNSPLLQCMYDVRDKAYGWYSTSTESITQPWIESVVDKLIDEALPDSEKFKFLYNELNEFRNTNPSQPREFDYFEMQQDYYLESAREHALIYFKQKLNDIKTPIDEILAQLQKVKDGGGAILPIDVKLNIAAVIEQADEYSRRDYDQTVEYVDMVLAKVRELPLEEEILLRREMDASADKISTTLVAHLGLWRSNTLAKGESSVQTELQSVRDASTQTDSTKLAAP